jgi:hypothetical protein
MERRSMIGLDRVNDLGKAFGRALVLGKGADTLGTFGAGGTFFT